MVIADEFRCLARAREGTTEAPHGERTARDARIVATLSPDGVTPNLELSPDEHVLKCSLQPDAFVPVPNRWDAQGWTSVCLDAITLPVLRSTLGLAWRHAQPRECRTKRRETTG